MRNIMIFAAIMIGLGTFMAQIADKMTPAPASATPATRLAVASDTTADASLRSLSIPRDGRGHFATEGRIDGQRIAFMVDTGASVIALNESSAARFGLRPSRNDYRATVTTANGTVKAAPIRLAMVELGGLIVRDVDAMVLPDEALSENLLGLSFLFVLAGLETVTSSLSTAFAALAGADAEIPPVGFTPRAGITKAGDGHACGWRDDDGLFEFLPVQ